jgi:hypothetical protein
MPNLSGASSCSAAMDGCATVARVLGGDPAGSSGHMTSWLLVEQPGPWAPEAAADAFAQLVDGERMTVLRAAGLRPLLVRRPGRHPRTGRARRTVFVGSGRPGNHWLERLELNDPSQLAEVDLEAVAEGRRGHGRPVSGPLLLVCTHGAKDMCCAVLGRPLVTDLVRDYPERVWEVSHVGGDRWAGNLLVVPDGYLHGQLDPAKAALVAKTAMSGQVHPDHLRGRTTATSNWEQAAEIAVRRLNGPSGIDDVLATAVRPDNGELTRVVEVSAGEHRYEVVVRRQVGETSAANRCSGQFTLTTYPVVHLRRLDTCGSGRDQV